MRSALRRSRWYGLLALAVWLAPTPAGSPATAAGRPYRCGEVADCTEHCGTRCPTGARRIGCLLRCQKQCRNAGCASARPSYDSLSSCVTGRCLIPCSKGPSPACRSCAARRCADRIGRCQQHRCVEYAGLAACGPG